MPKKTPLFDYSICMACSICQQICPASCISMDKIGLDKYNNAYPILYKIQDCIGCGFCEKSCPVEAIQMQEDLAEPVIQ